MLDRSKAERGCLYRPVKKLKSLRINRSLRAAMLRGVRQAKPLL